MNVANIKTMKRPVQGELPLWRGRWGGARPEAGRPRLNNGRVPHLPRKGRGPKYPWLVTLKVREGMSSLRTVAVVRAVEDAFRRMRGREGFRLVHYSIQGNHLHAIVEARDVDALGRGMMSLGIRFARAVNRALRRKGPVVWDRYHAKVLESPTQVRNAIRYVLLNARRHAAQVRGSKPLLGPVRLDPASSARWFEGWRWRPRDEDEAARASPPAVSRPRSWLLEFGWSLRRGGLDPSDVPGRV
jgi:REP-associated tyrosine transposase